MKTTAFPIVVRMNAGPFERGLLRLAAGLFWAWALVCIEDLTRAYGNPTNDVW